MFESNKVLVVDAGNTALKWTLLERQAVHQKWVGDHSPDVRPEHVVLASVRSPERTADLAQMLRLTYPDAVITQVESTADACGVKNSYTQPHRLGVDRWLAVIAAYREFGGPCVVIDAGTAIKVDFVSAQGVHLGGYIVPGLDLMASSLVANTARIRFEQHEISEHSQIPCSTADAVNQGCLQMALGFLQRMYVQHRDATWLVTGGTGRQLMSLLDLPCIMDEHLVAKGAYQVVATSDKR